MDIKDKVLYSDLLGLYGKLLSDRQFEILNLYYNLDISLVEIGDRFSISRQGAYDAIKKGEKALAIFEEKMGLNKKLSSLNKDKYSKEEILKIIKD